jgi:micrococcal nuclease
MNTVRFFIFLIFFAVIGYSLAMSGLLDKDTSVLQKLECSDDIGECFETTVLRITDGDTIVSVQDERIRFSLASAPELSEPGGDEAKEFIEELCPVGSRIIIDEDDKQMNGSYGRIIALVTCNGINLNDRLLEGGHGTMDTRYCKNSEFATESWAKECGLTSDEFSD